MSQDPPAPPNDAAEPEPEPEAPAATTPDAAAATTPDAPAATPEAPGPAVATQPDRSRRLAIVVAAVAGVVILAVIGAVAVANQLGDDLPEAGDCMSNDADPTEIRVVDCGSEDAAWTVIGQDGTWTEREFDEADRNRICQAFPKWDNALWLGEETDDRSGEGTVVCLTVAGPE
ncbi:MAG: hypothetical protein GEV12_05895 [Micromonosporaceae bacterium]|nr:hypothetical protein [Micromonosporaceae bacterium]